MVRGLGDIWESITSLPSKIINLIKEIFIPDTEVIKEQFDDMILSIETKLGFNTSSIDNFKNTWEERPAQNITGSYAIPGVKTFNLTFLDTTYLKKGVEYFRPIIRGFIVLLLIFFNYKMILSFIGQDPGMYAHAKEEADKK